MCPTLRHFSVAGRHEASCAAWNGSFPIASCPPLKGPTMAWFPWHRRPTAKAAKCGRRITSTGSVPQPHRPPCRPLARSDAAVRRAIWPVGGALTF